MTTDLGLPRSLWVAWWYMPNLMLAQMDKRNTVVLGEQHSEDEN